MRTIEIEGAVISVSQIVWFRREESKVRIRTTCGIFEKTCGTEAEATEYVADLRQRLDNLAGIPEYRSPVSPVET